MSFAPRPPAEEVFTLSDRPSGLTSRKEFTEASASSPRAKGFTQLARRQQRSSGSRASTESQPRSARASAEAPTTSRRTAGPRPSTADAGRYSMRSRNGHAGGDRARRSEVGFWASPPSPDEVDPRKARSLDTQRKAAGSLARKAEASNIDRIAHHKPTRSLREQVLTNSKIRPDDDMLNDGAMKHSKWKGHDDPFSILSTEERLRQGLATRMRAASYTKGGMDWALLFARYDRDHSGGLDFKEFSTALQRDGSIGQSITLAEMQQIFDYIDLDRDGLIVLEELQTFLDSELRKHQDGSVKQQGAKSARIQKFLAESITLERVVMREKAGLNSQKVGTLSAGEIVAVTHVAGNRIHVRRLKWSLDLEQQDASTDGGWVSERAAGGSGRLLVEVLPRDEWTSKTFIEAALVDRVEQLAAMRRLASGYTVPGLLGKIKREGRGRSPTPREQARSLENGYPEEEEGEQEGAEEKGERSPQQVEFTNNGQRVGGEDLTAARSSSPGRSTAGNGDGDGSGVDVPGMLAAKILERCREPEEVTALLNILETEPRENWATMLAPRGRR